MNKLQRALAQIRQRQIGLMTHVVIGYPSLEETVRLVKTMEKSGADMIELQIPFSDPLADGPVIMNACELALKNGIRVATCFSLMKRLSKEASIPLLFMCYYNTVFRFGVEKFIRLAKAAGCCGLIVPDMPLEEESYEHFYLYCKQYDMPAIFVVSPITSNERLKRIALLATGFVYATTRQGVTGVRNTVDNTTVDFLKRVKQHISLPVVVGFGISTKDQVLSVKGFADMVVVGSALLSVVNKSENIMKGVSEFITSLMIE